jgi:hypothetical protein
MRLGRPSIGSIDELEYKQNDDEGKERLGSGCPCQPRLSFTAKQA